MFIPDIIPEQDRRMFEKGKMGGRIGFGRKAAIVVVDMTKGFVEDRFPLGCSRTGLPCVNSIKELLGVARPLGILVAYTIPVEVYSYICKYSPPEGGPKLYEQGEAQEIPEAIAPRPEDVVIRKTKPSAFFGTHLQSVLTYHGVDTLIVTGMVTSGCVRATVVDAFSYNYRVIVPIECVADRGEVSHQVSLFDMDMKYADVLPLSEVLEGLSKLAKPS